MTMRCGWCLCGDHAHHHPGSDRDGTRCDCPADHPQPRHTANLYACLLCGGSVASPDHACTPTTEGVPA